MRDNNNLYNKALRSNIYFVFVFKIIFCSSKLVFFKCFHIFIRTTPDTSASGLITIRKMISMIIMMIIIIVA